MGAFPTITLFRLGLLRSALLCLFPSHYLFGRCLDLCDVGKERFLKRWRCRHPDVRRGDSPDVQRHIGEQLGQAKGNFAGKSPGSYRFVKNDHIA